jgi:hypothetical protein
VAQATGALEKNVKMIFAEVAYASLVVIAVAEAIARAILALLAKGIQSLLPEGDKASFIEKEIFPLTLEGAGISCLAGVYSIFLIVDNLTSARLNLDEISTRLDGLLAAIV